MNKVKFLRFMYSTKDRVLFSSDNYKSNLLITNKSKLINILGENIIGKSYQECGFSHRINC